MSKSHGFIDELHDEFKNDPDYILESFLFEVAEQICVWMKEAGLNQAQLAARMGLSEARISQILRGGKNLTFATFVRIAIALDRKPTLSMAVHSESLPEQTPVFACTEETTSAHFKHTTEKLRRPSSSSRMVATTTVTSRRAAATLECRQKDKEPHVFCPAA